MKITFLVPLIAFLLNQQRSYSFTVEAKDTVFIYTNEWHKCNWNKCLFPQPIPKSYFHSNFDMMDEFEFPDYYKQKLHFDHPSWTMAEIEKEMGNFKYCKI